MAIDSNRIVTGGADNRVLVFSLKASQERIKLREILFKEEEYCVKMNVYNQVIEAKEKKKKKPKQSEKTENLVDKGEANKPGKPINKPDKNMKQKNVVRT